MTILRSTITCPQCGHTEAVDMPTNACQYFYHCPYCSVIMRPKTGDCCIFCSYGSVRCPPKQVETLEGREAQ